MFWNLISKRLVAMLAAAGLLAVAQLSGPATTTAAPAIENVSDYPPRALTDTEVSLEHRTVRPGQSNTAYARVSSDGANPNGRVRFKVSGHQAETVVLQNGRASYDMPRDLEAGKRYKVTARYKGNRIYRPSSDSAWVTVERGNGEVAGTEGEGGKNRSGPTQGDGEVAGEEAGVLPSVGSDEGMLLYGLVGLGLLGAGGLLLLLRRRNAAG